MAQLTLLDVSRNEEIVVPPEGFVFGRAGGDADIQLEDSSISRRQARVSNRQGTWMLETMVVPPGQRLPRPQALQQGQQFSIGATEFEVLAMESDEADSVAATFAPTRSKPGPAPVAAPIPKKAAPAPSNQRTMPAAPAQKRPAPKPAAAPPPEEPDEQEEQDDEPQSGEGAEAPAKGGIGALFVGVPKGIAYYLLNVPKLLVNPLGAVKKTIAELPSEPIAKVGLIGYALPALFISALLPAIGTGIGLLIGPGHVFSIGAFLPIGPAIGSIIGALIFGFFFHPVMAWIITKLQGESDERSRSNYFLQFMTATLLLSVPNALAAILANIRWVNLLAPFISTAASLVMTYLMYQWLVFFKVHHIVPKVVAVLGALSVVFTILGLVSGVQRNLAWASTSTPSSASTDADDAAEAAVDEIDTSGMSAENKAAVEAAQAQAKKALEDAKKMQADAEKATGEATAAVAAKPEKARKDAKKDAKKEPKDEPKDEPEQAATPDERPPAAVAEEPSRDTAGSGAYGTYVHRRDAVEKRLAADPTALAADSELQKLYGEYQNEVYEIDRKYDKDRSKNPGKVKLYEHLRDAELFKRTGAQVERLSGKLGVK
jgi:putative flippase GtrA